MIAHNIWICPSPPRIVRKWPLLSSNNLSQREVSKIYGTLINNFNDTNHQSSMIVWSFVDNSSSSWFSKCNDASPSIPLCTIHPPSLQAENCQTFSIFFYDFLVMFVPLHIMFVSFNIHHVVLMQFSNYSCNLLKI